MGKSNDSNTSPFIVVIIIILWSILFYFLGSEGGIHPFGIRNFLKRSSNIITLKAIKDPSNNIFDIKAPKIEVPLVESSGSSSSSVHVEEEEKESIFHHANESLEKMEIAHLALH